MALLRLDLIGHSGFALECAECVLVFDLYLDPASVMERVIRLGKPVVFLSSHAHSDHWNPGWLDYQIPHACYVLDVSCDAPAVRQRIDPARQRYTTVRAYQTLDPVARFGAADAARFLPGIEWIRTFGSTDMGVSFMLSVDGNLVFHAGDLNDWYWAQESTPEELESSEAAFRRELRNVCDAMDGLAPRGLDLVMFPVDGRLGEHATRGARVVAVRLAPKWLVPMHLCGDLSLPGRLTRELAACGLSATDVLPLTEPGQHHLFTTDHHA